MATKTTRNLSGDAAGRNVMVAVANGILTIQCDVSEAARDRAQESKSGKTMVVATTNGNVGLAGTDLKLGLNLYFPHSRDSE